MMEKNNLKLDEVKAALWREFYQAPVCYEYKEEVHIEWFIDRVMIRLKKLIETKNLKGNDEKQKTKNDRGSKSNST